MAAEEAVKDEWSVAFRSAADAAVVAFGFWSLDWWRVGWLAVGLGWAIAVRALLAGLKSMMFEFSKPTE